MKVILLAPTPPPAGGIAGWTSRMQNATLSNGWKVKVVDEKLMGNREVFGANSKPNFFIEIKRCIRIWKNLISALDDDEVKVVHSCIPATTKGMMRELICALLSKFKKRKFIIHYRCTLPNMVKSRYGRMIFRCLTNISNLAIVLNSPSEQFIKKYSNKPVRLIPNFIEKSSIMEENSKLILNEIKQVLYVGGVIESKGCFDIIHVAKEFPNIKFRLVGNVDKKIMESKFPLNVILCGEKNKMDIKKELGNADLFMFVSYFSGEGFSNALAEAMSYGLPCLVTDWAANKDMIEEYGGIVVKIKDIPAMIESIKVLSNDKERRKSQSNWNINKVKKYYSDTIVTDMYVDSYEYTLNE